MSRIKSIIGASEFKKALRENATLDDVKSIVKMNGSELTYETQWKAPLDTGTLERSITQEIKDGGLTSITEPHTDYAGHVEWGTRYMAAQPYFRPVFKKQSKQFKKDMERLVK